MNWLWTWGGVSFGYFDGADLVTYDGRHVGRLAADGSIYSPRGRYLGEMTSDRLITNLSKKNWMGNPFAPYGPRGGFARYANYAGYAMYAGFEDFPAPEDL